MAIVSEVPFELKICRHFPSYNEVSGKVFFTEEKDVWINDDATFSVEENEEISVIFKSSDSDAKLYINALDIVGIEDNQLFEDIEGHLYRAPSETPFYLYKNDGYYDELRVDEMLIKVICNNLIYYGKLIVLPKPVSMNEWRMMRDDIESEMRGLSQDLIKKNVGLGGKHNAVLPPKLMYDFLVIENYSYKILPALIDISKNPRYEIKTYYERVPNKNVYDQSYDSETIKRIVKSSGSESTISIPVKKSEYDIQDNRILKMILNIYEKKLEEFISVIDNTSSFSLKTTSDDDKSIIKSDSGIVKFKEIAIKLKKITSIIRTQKWYGTVKLLDSPYIPHSLIMDTRYNIIYQMYQELRRDELKIEFDSRFSYTWKRSSLLYEMWCYFKICRILLNHFDIMSEEWNITHEGKFLFPLLEEGTSVIFMNEKCIVELIYDNPLPRNSNSISLDNPLYIAQRTDARNHNRPDILLNAYSKDKKVYFGSLIFECKYRKLSSFWNRGERSSRGQLESYYNNARSPLLFEGYGEKLNMRPVNKVVALTPDSLGDGTEGEDFNIIVKPFKPSIDSLNINSVEKLIIDELDEMIEKANIINRY